MGNRSNQEDSDEQVVDRLQNGGSSKNFEVLYHRYLGKVTDKCYGLLKNRRQAEEFAEDIFSKVYERLSSFQRKSSFSTWLYSITYNHCIDYLRQKKNLHYPRWDSEQAALEVPDDEEVTDDITYERLMPIFDLIHPEEKVLLLMKYMDNLSLKQISQSLRISETAAKMRLKRARTRVMIIYHQKYLND